MHEEKKASKISGIRGHARKISAKFGAPKFEGDLH